MRCLGLRLTILKRDQIHLRIQVYFSSAVAAALLLRKQGCKLPVEIWHADGTHTTLTLLNSCAQLYVQFCAILFSLQCSVPRSAVIRFAELVCSTFP